MSFPPAPPTNIDPTTLTEPVYRGSVQYLYPVPDHPSYLVCQTTEAGSVFDVGSIFHIEGNDLSRALFRHAMYTRLAQPATWARVKTAIEADPHLDTTWKTDLLTGPLEAMLESGARTHHVGMIDATTGNVVSGAMPDNPSTFNVVRRFPVMTPPQRPCSAVLSSTTPSFIRATPMSSHSNTSCASASPAAPPSSGSTNP